MRKTIVVLDLKLLHKNNYLKVAMKVVRLPANQRGRVSRNIQESHNNEIFTCAIKCIVGIH